MMYLQTLQRTKFLQIAFVGTDEFKVIVQNLLSSILPTWIQLSKEKKDNHWILYITPKFTSVFFITTYISSLYKISTLCLNEISHLLGGAAQESSVVLRLCTISWGKTKVVFYLSVLTSYTNSSKRAVWLNSLRKCIEICSLEFLGLLAWLDK